ncbi:MAG: FAD/NAD(P)-binding protein [Polyangiaceae bacterium]|nr:FAD/NAD(P)-binding protein [Polyangiaceae bacterium]
MHTSCDWLIIGGGIHGVHLAARLVGEAGIPVQKIQIVDPRPTLMSRWREMTSTTGMTHLRSPSAHHLDPQRSSLYQFGTGRGEQDVDNFAAPCNRPLLGLFNQHCDHVVAQFGLREIHVQDRALSCSLHCDGAKVQLAERGLVSAQNVILAIGASEQPHWPGWAPKNHERVQHIFSLGESLRPQMRETVAVIGGGISAVQLALRLMKEGNDVHLLARHALRCHQFDSDLTLLRRRFKKDFQAQTSYKKRREFINHARNQGSVPPETQNQLEQALESGLLQFSQSEVESARPNEEGIVLQLAQGKSLEVQRVILATGFCSKRPGGDLVQSLIDSAKLPCASCGYPVVDSMLRWHPRIRVAGPLAELELGPTARNIVGARRAGDRLLFAGVALS